MQESSVHWRFVILALKASGLDVFGRWEFLTDSKFVNGYENIHVFYIFIVKFDNTY